jgi:hypothetical protein
MARQKVLKRLTISSTYKGMDANTILKHYPERFLVCRRSHDWPRRAIWRDLSESVRERTLQCRRCGYTKTVLQDVHGQPLDRERTRHPPGYQTPGSGLKRGTFVALAYVQDYELAKAQDRVLGIGDEIQ